MTDAAIAHTRTQYWKAQIDAWQASGQSQLAFCKGHDLNYARFGYWRRKFRERDAVAGGSRGASGFVPVVAPSTSGDLTLRLPNGIELQGITADNLALVEQLLARLC